MWQSAAAADDTVFLGRRRRGIPPACRVTIKYDLYYMSHVIFRDLQWRFDVDHAEPWFLV